MNFIDLLLKELQCLMYNVFFRHPTYNLHHEATALIFAVMAVPVGSDIKNTSPFPV
jgi:hypothetical protein